MVHISEYSTVTYEREPGHWRAALFPKVVDRSCAPGLTVRSIITPDDSESEVSGQVCGRTAHKETQSRHGAALAIVGLPCAECRALMCTCPRDRWDLSRWPLFSPEL